MLSKPLQVWLPNIQGSLSNPKTERDRRRSYDVWRGTDVVWLLPDAEQETTFSRTLGQSRTIVLYESHAIVPSETLERVDIYHIGTNGYGWGPGFEERFGGKSVEGLFSTYINMDQVGGQSISVAPGPFIIETPKRKGDKIAYDKQVVRFQPNWALPLLATDDENWLAVFGFSHANPSVKVVAPEAETLGLEENEGRDGAEDGYCLVTMLSWPGRLSKLFTPGSGPDDIEASREILEVIKLSQRDPELALAQAHTKAARYMDQGWSFPYKFEVLPIFQKEGIAGLSFYLEGRYGVVVDSLESFFSNPSLQKEVMQVTPIRRAWGASGLMWALLLDQLEASRIYRPCQRCNRLITGRRHKLVCGRGDDEECFKAGQKLRKQRQRRKQG